jgi:hypothetical protein
VKFSFLISYWLPGDSGLGLGLPPPEVSSVPKRLDLLWLAGLCKPIVQNNTNFQIVRTERVMAERIGRGFSKNASTSTI